tara:strand:+ start:418 stop:636 length:219 start_codon:yes stop_codon:yes gene_type:complete
MPWIACLILLGNILPLWLFGGLRCVSDCCSSNEPDSVSRCGMETDEEDSVREDIGKHEKEEITVGGWWGELD